MKSKQFDELILRTLKRRARRTGLTTLSMDTDLLARVQEIDPSYIVQEQGYVDSINRSRLRASVERLRMAGRIHKSGSARYKNIAYSSLAVRDAMQDEETAGQTRKRVLAVNAAKAVKDLAAIGYEGKVNNSNTMVIIMVKGS